MIAERCRLFFAFDLCPWCAANKLKHVEEGKGSLEQEQDPKLQIEASSVGGKAQIGSVEHLQQVENRRAVKVLHGPPTTPPPSFPSPTPGLLYIDWLKAAKWKVWVTPSSVDTFFAVHLLKGTNPAGRRPYHAPCYGLPGGPSALLIILQNKAV